MSNGTTLIGRGGLLLTLIDQSNSQETLLRLRYEIQSSGITFYRLPAKSDEVVDRGTPINLFDWLNSFSQGRSLSVKSRSAYLSLLSLPATPDAAFCDVTLTYSGSQLSLNVLKLEPFAHHASVVQGAAATRVSNVFFKELNLSFTVNRTDPKVVVSGGVKAVLFGQAIPLTAAFRDATLVFGYTLTTATPLAPIALGVIGDLNLQHFEVGYSGSRWNGLQALYAFDEPANSQIIYDSSGSKDASGQGIFADLEIRNLNKVRRIEPLANSTNQPNGIVVDEGGLISSRTSPVRLIRNFKSSNALTVEAWIKSTLRNPQRPGPVRIVTLSKDISERNFTLAQDADSPDRYIVRLRRTHPGTNNNGQPELLSQKGALLLKELAYVVFTRDQEGNARLYVNGLEQSDALNRPDFKGNFSQWDENSQLALANELTRDRSWAGEMYGVAIYNRSLTAEEVERNYLPSIRAKGTLTVANGVVPLDVVPVEIVQLRDRTQLIFRPTGAVSVTPELQLEQINLVWQKIAGDSTPWTVSGQVTANLWGSSLGPLSLRLQTLNNQPALAFRRDGMGQLSLPLEGLGTLNLTQFELRTNPTTSPTSWEFQTDARVALVSLAPPLDRPFDARLGIAGTTLQLKIASSTPLPVVDYLAFTQVDLTFTRSSTAWDVQGGVQVALFSQTRDQALSLIPRFIDTNTGRALVLERQFTSVVSLIQSPVTLDAANLSLRSTPTPTGAFWQVSSTSQLLVPNFTSFNGSLALETAAEGEQTPGRRRLFFVASPASPQVQFPLVANAAAPILTMTARMGRFDCFNTTVVNGVPGPDTWVVTALADLQFDQIDREILRVDFWGDRTGIRFSRTRLERPLSFNLANPSFNNQPITLGQVVFDVRNFVVTLASQPSLTADLSARLPVGLDQLLGPAGVRPNRRFFADTVDLRLEINAALGLQLNVTTSFLQAEISRLRPGSPAALTLNLQPLINATFSPPQLKFVGSGFVAEGQVNLKTLVIPLALAKNLLTSYGLPQLASALPTKLPAVGSLIPQGKLTSNDILNWLEAFGKSESATLPRAEFLANLNALATQLNALPELFGTYLTPTPPTTINYRLRLMTDAGVSLELWADRPIQVLALAGEPISGIFGLTLRQVTISSLFGGSLHTAEVDATVDYFDLSALVDRLALTGESAAQLPSARDLQSQLTARNLFTTITYPKGVAVTTPLFFADLGFDWLGIEGLGFGLHWQFDDSQVDYFVKVALLASMSNFLSDPVARLTDNPFASSNLPLQFVIASASSQLPPYAAGNPSSVLSASTSTTGVNQFLDRLNALRQGQLGNLMRQLPLAQRVGTTIVTFGPMQVDAAWAVLSQAEFPDSVLTPATHGVLLPKLALIADWQRQGLATLIQFEPERSRGQGQDDTAITFVVGNWTREQRTDLKLCLGLAQSLSQGYGSGFSISGQLGQDGGLPLANVIDFNASGQIVIDCNNLQQPLRLDGQSSLHILSEQIFDGDIELVGDRFKLNGYLTLFPRWSPLQISSDVQIDIAPDATVTFLTPVNFSLADFTLLDPRLSMENGRLTLNGLWLGQPLTLIGIQRDNQFILQGQITFTIPFNLSLGPIYEPQTAIKLVERLSVIQEPEHPHDLQASLQVELSASGCLIQVTSQFQAEDESHTVHKLAIPKFTLFAPPTSRNDLLGQILTELSRRSHEILAPQLNHASDYYFTASEGKPLIYMGQEGKLSQDAIATQLPLLFATEPQTVSAENLFQLEQKEGTCQLTIAPSDKTQVEIEKAYRLFLNALAKLENSTGLLPGAVNLIQRRIAERLPTPLDRVLFYHYGLDTTRGGYLDLQAGMRLRVDYQNYQDVPPAERTASTVNGFVGSGTSYYNITSYLHPSNTGAPLYSLGFDPFISRLSSVIQTDASKDGASSVLDLLKIGFRQPYYRLFYPSQFSDQPGPRNTERTIAIVGAASLNDLQIATQEYLERGAIQATSDSSRVSFFFRGRVTVIPEITIFVQEQPVYIPVGTTLRQLSERYSAIPAAGFRQQDLQSFWGQLRPRRIIHEGINNTPIDRFLYIHNYQQFDNGMDHYDLPLVKGDRFYF